MSDRRRGLFVTGTDTGVGKTVVSAALVAVLRQRIRVRYWKPIQTGIEQDDDTDTVRRLSRCLPRDLFTAGVRLHRPLSPHAAAALAGTAIDLDDLTTLGSAQAADEFWIVEGAGGVLVPINAQALMRDLIERLSMPALVVVRSGLGTINHTLLTIEALRHRSLAIAGVVMVGEPNPANREAIEEYGGVRVVGEMPVVSPLTCEAIEEAASRWMLPVLTGDAVR